MPKPESYTENLDDTIWGALVEYGVMLCFGALALFALVAK